MALAALAAASLAALALPLAAVAAYPPGPFPGAAPGGAFTTIMTSAIVCADGGSLEAPTAHGLVRAEIPANTFTDCTQVTIYAGDDGVIDPILPAGATLADAFAVGWRTNPVAAAPAAAVTASTELTLIIEDSTITTAATVYRTTGTGIAVFDGASVVKGRVTSHLLDPTGVAVAMPGEGPGPETTPPPTSVAPTTSSRPSSSPVGGWVLLFVAMGVLLVVPRPRRRRSRS